MDVIEPDHTEYVPPIAFVPKKDGTLWLWVNYRK